MTRVVTLEFDMATPRTTDVSLRCRGSNDKVQIVIRGGGEVEVK